MQLKTRIIVIGTIKYGDTSLIARCYSETLGFQSYLLKGILSAKKTGLKKGLFQPLSELAAVVYHHPQRELHHIREAQLIASSHFQQPDVVQQTITLFLAEVVQEVLQEEAEPNPGLYAFLASAIQFLEHSAYKANFHLKFLIEMTKFIGFYPSVDPTEKAYFDLESGNFQDQKPTGPYLEGVTLFYFKRLFGTNFDKLHTLQLDKDVKKELLNAILNYYSLHLQHFGKPKSLQILQTVFA